VFEPLQTISSSVIKTLFFDAAGTLFHLPRGVGWHYADVARRFGCVVEPDTLSTAFRTAWREMPARLTTHEPRPDDDRGWWQTLVEKALDLTGPSTKDLDRQAYFDALYPEFTQPGIWELFPEVPEVLAELAPKYRLGIISNFDRRLRPILKNLGVADNFDPIIISSEVGADKPDPWIFQSALTLAQISANEALHIGDEPRSDWQGATEAGLHVFHLDRPQNSLRDLIEHLRENAPPRVSS
jgi:putative hydrolase of the HAD superfamily